MKLSKTSLEDVRELILSARATVSRGVDLVQVHTNFKIGRRIVEQEQKGKSRAKYGEAVVMALAERLTAEFGRGFSASNLAYMRTFYLLYRGRLPIVQSVIAKSSADETSQTLSGQSPIFQSVIGKLESPKKSQFLTGKSSVAPPRPFTLSWTHYRPKLLT
jgi:hypothetical protein